MLFLAGFSLFRSAVPRRSRAGGFTLIELSFVLIIIALLFSAFLQALKIYDSRQRYEATYNAMDMADKMIAGYLGTSGVEAYPCPAVPNLPPDDPNYGVSKCTGLPAVGTCVNGFCRLNGRDINGDGVGETLLIGALPVTTLNTQRLANSGANTSTSTAISNVTTYLSAKDFTDGWGNQLTYAVTEAMTSKATFKNDGSIGAITVQDEFGESLTKNAGAAHYVLISHGEDGLGAYDRNGVAMGACDIIVDPTDPDDTRSADAENCDNDDPAFTVGILSVVPGTTHFDDLVKFAYSQGNNIWNRSGNVVFNGNSQGSIGVGTDDPILKLDIAGSFRTPNYLRARQICNGDGSSCFSPYLIGGDPSNCRTSNSLPDTFNKCLNQCPNGQVMTGVQDGKVVCIAVGVITPSTVIATDTTHCDSTSNSCTCPDGKYFAGIDSNGSIRCQ